MAKTPYGSASLIAMRKGGRAPALPVLVSLVGSLEFDNVTLQAKAGERYDWRLVAALDIELFASTQVPFAALLQTLGDIAYAVPRSMVLTFVEGPRVECGEMRALRDFALFDWFPIAIAPRLAENVSAWSGSTKLARSLWAELGNRLPIPYDEAVPLVLQVNQEAEACA